MTNPIHKKVDEAMRRFQQRSVNNYMLARNIGASAVDLIPLEIRQPCGPIRTNDGLYKWCTPGRLKLGMLFVRSAWSKP